MYTVEVLCRGRHVGFKDDHAPELIHAETYPPDPLGYGHDLKLWMVRHKVRATVDQPGTAPDKLTAWAWGGVRP